MDEREKKRRRGTAAVTGALCLALAGLLIFLAVGRRGGGDAPVTLDGSPLETAEVRPDSPDPLRVTVTLDGKTVADLPFGEPHRLRIRQEDGGENVLVMTGSEVYMESADCEGQDCMEMEPVTRENRETRSLGGWIICLPHRVAVEIRAR